MDANLKAVLAAAEQLLSVKQVAEKFEVEPRIVRREARNGNIPGTVKILGKVGFDPQAILGWTPPAPGVFGARAPKREDGRSWYKIALSTDEAAALLAEGKEVVDPRVAAKERRVARKAAKAAQAENDGAKAAEPVAAEGDNPFAEFDL